MTSTNPWSWADDQLVSFNLVRDRSLVDLLRFYDADPAGARTVMRKESDAAFGLPDEGTVLRVGRAGAWSFCFENWLPVGFDPGLLERLSAGTDTIHYFRNPKGGRFVNHLRDGRDLERFELGMPPAPSEEAPLGLHRAIEQRAGEMEKGLDYPEHRALWEVLSELVGVRLDNALVNGPLLTVLRPSGPLRYDTQGPAAHGNGPVSSPPVGGPSRRGLGRSLGPLIPWKPEVPDGR
ncbi:DUF6461 domain-containing protein [Streptomyces sp. NPDC057486]|uniref:DUF6461 domain-containing protein n=1 Tax=Streptomyces sp. NPDC057486 TaxID=3346145 RepID=UPI0036CD6716